MTTGLIPWTTWPFPASGAPTPRTQPVRLAEIKNVKDFGAAGDSVTNDTQAIQNAVNWTSGANRGTIFFPRGSYLVTSPITFNYNGPLSIYLRGEGGSSTVMFANSFGGAGAGYVFDRSLVSPSNQAQVIIEGFGFSGNDSGDGAIRLGSCSNVAVRNCALGGFTSCLTLEDSPGGNSSTGFFISNNKFTGGLAALVTGGSGVITANDWISSDVAAWLYGNGWSAVGNRIERCNTAYLIGLNSATAATFTATVAGTVLTVAASPAPTGTIKIGQRLRGPGVPGGVSILSLGTGTGAAGTYNLTANPQFNVSSATAMTTQGVDAGASGFEVGTGSTEGNLCSVDLAGTCSGFQVGPLSMLGHDGTNCGPSNVASITGSVSAGVLTVTAGDPGQAILPGFTLVGAGVPAGVIIMSYGTGTGGAGTYNLNNSGFSVSSEALTAQPPGTQYGVLVRANKASQGLIFGCGTGQFTDVAGGEVDASTSRAGLLVQSNQFVRGPGGAGVDFIPPSNAYTAQFQYNSTSPQQPIWTYSQLPTGANVFEGDQFVISDAKATNCSDGTCGWGANVTGGGGALHRLVRWNGANWTVVGE